MINDAEYPQLAMTSLIQCCMVLSFVARTDEWPCKHICIDLTRNDWLILPVNISNVLSILKKMISTFISLLLYYVYEAKKRDHCCSKPLNNMTSVCLYYHEQIRVLLQLLNRNTNFAALLCTKWQKNPYNLIHFKNHLPSFCPTLQWWNRLMSFTFLLSDRVCVKGCFVAIFDIQVYDWLVLWLTIISFVFTYFRHL